MKKKKDKKLNILEQKVEKYQADINKIRDKLDLAQSKLIIENNKVKILKFKKSIGSCFKRIQENALSQNEEFISLVGFEEVNNLGVAIVVYKTSEYKYNLLQSANCGDMIYEEMASYEKISKKEFDKNYNEVLSMLENKRIISRDVIIEKK